MDPRRAYDLLLAELFEARARDGDEGPILNRMDVVWLKMSQDDHAHANAIGAALANGQITEEDFIRSVREGG